VARLKPCPTYVTFSLEREAFSRADDARLKGSRSVHVPFCVKGRDSWKWLFCDTLL